MSRPIELSRTDPNHRRPLVTTETTDPAPTPPEVLREQVQAAAADAVRNMPADWWCPERSNTTRFSCEYCIAEVAADAALAVFRGQQDPAVQRVLKLHEASGPLTRSGRRACMECSDPENGMTMYWPCDTVRAINGELPR